MTTKAILIINLGTPNSPEIKAVRSYLAEFLMDPRVIQLPKIIRLILVYGLILPFRPRRSAHAYQQIWTAAGSPLKVHTENLAKKLQQASQIPVYYAMRYGQPQIASVLAELKSYQQLIILPLYPQYASATTGSSLAAVFEYYKTQAIMPSIKIIRDFYQHPAFINAVAESIRTYLGPQHHLLLSYHGLPEQQLKSLGCQPICHLSCSKNTNGCYRQQCYASSNAIAQALNITTTQYSVAFQSRLGRTPWIKPYTDESIEALAKQGIKKLVVACPSFVADCLETIEEIGMQARKQWADLGGEEFILVPCLNDQDTWVQGIMNMLSTF